MSSALTQSRLSYAAAVVGCVTYGCYFVLAAICLHFQMNHTQRHQKWPWLIYNILIFVVSTIYFIGAAIWSEVEFVETTVNPSEFAGLLSSPLSILKDTASVVNIWLADSLIIYRAYIIWGGSWHIIILPVLIYFSSIGTGIVLLYASAQPNTSFGASAVTHFGTAFWSISVALNIIVTLLIAGRLIMAQHALKHVQVESSSHYNPIIATFAESAALYSISGLFYIAFFVRNNPIFYVFNALFCSMTSIAPTLIILRVALGVAYTKDSIPGATITNPVKFRTAGTRNSIDSTSFDPSTTAVHFAPKATGSGLTHSNDNSVHSLVGHLPT
ncbi:hypothetical protein EV368DRAFT_48992 [Lentinula lateritia]|uniref:Uncharacterized protein n=1 Tax=Lentinula aff. lateritia TaxID=2804960 RepID=A0ACC1U0G5_9AGAR|nr:hypothetical protein F5876DRAFT_41859 [Lentinula aff. lateritia]KAJ3848602.1 hypothetical protein EV368DRAFT_48992 [Lentinula lateritia]